VGGMAIPKIARQNTNTMEEEDRSVDRLGHARLSDPIASLLMGLIVVQVSCGSWAKKQAALFFP
jgi:hypothetical protein